MPTTPQTQNPGQDQQNKYSNQSNAGQKTEDPASKAGSSKDDQAAKNRTGGMKDKDGDCSSSDKKSTESGCN